MNKIDWINDVKGKPWEDRATGDDAYDCWGLVVDSFARVDGVPLHEVDGYESGEAIETAGAIEQESGEWEGVSEAEDGAVFCVYDESGAMIHVGRVFYVAKAGLYAIHSRGEGGQVRADRMRAINKVYPNIKYFKRVL